MSISAMERLTMYMLVMLCICLLASTATNTSKFPLTPTWWGLVLLLQWTNCDSFVVMITKNFVAATIIIIAVTMTIELTRKIVR